MLVYEIALAAGLDRSFILFSLFVLALYQIVFLEHGKVIEKGTHEELQQQNGRYSSYLETLKGN